MPSRTINHQCLEIESFKISVDGPKTLVLGSFNPFESIEKSVDYYYGRTSNYFWKTIAVLLDKNEDYFFGCRGYKHKVEVCNEFSFICMDVIDSIEFSCDNENRLIQYINNNVYSNFLDQKIWCVNTERKNEYPIKLQRNYNRKIIELLNTNSSITKVIHTMGNNRINNPPEIRLREEGFAHYLHEIKSICNERNIIFEIESLSPSEYAVRTGKTKVKDLKSWIKENLGI